MHQCTVLAHHCCLRWTHNCKVISTTSATVQQKTGCKREQLPNWCAYTGCYCHCVHCCSSRLALFVNMTLVTKQYKDHQGNKGELRHPKLLICVNQCIPGLRVSLSHYWRCSVIRYNVTSSVTGTYWVQGCIGSRIYRQLQMSKPALVASDGTETAVSPLQTSASNSATVSK